ncbi:hypothetical protein Tco_0699147 [Tanacetum coccineum]
MRRQPDAIKRKRENRWSLGFSRSMHRSCDTFPGGITCYCVSPMTMKNLINEFQRLCRPAFGLLGGCARMPSQGEDSAHACLFVTSFHIYRRSRHLMPETARIDGSQCYTEIAS